MTKTYFIRISCKPRNVAYAAASLYPTQLTKYIWSWSYRMVNSLKRFNKLGHLKRAATSNPVFLLKDVHACLHCLIFSFIASDIIHIVLLKFISTLVRPLFLFLSLSSPLRTLPCNLYLLCMYTYVFLHLCLCQ